MYECLNNLNARNVVVEFEYNGVKVSNKIDVRNLIKKLVTENIFRCGDFTIKRNGTNMFRLLGVRDYKAGLNCGDITKITYGEKVIYTREQ
jgi:hypothetical protein